MAKRRGKPRLGKTGCLFWLFIFLVIIVIILYRGKGSFKETFSLLKNKLSTQEVQDTDRPSEITLEDSKDIEPENDTIIDEYKGDIPAETTEVQPRSEATQEPDRGTEQQAQPDKSTGEKEPEVISTKSIRAPIYYVKIEADGSARLQPVIRSINFKDSPITRTIESLLIGPSADEASKGLISFIPEGTDLLSAQLRNGLLTLNFSSSFEQNYNGREAIRFQLSQILLTSFEFKQVTGLTILIDGQKKRYITGEGIPLKEVYKKDDLSMLSTRG